MSLFAGIETGDLNAEVKTSGGGLRVMDAGVYEDCVITEVAVHKESADKDGDWAILNVVFEKDGFFPKREFVMVPKKSMDTYAGKVESAEPMVAKLGRFFKALGLPVEKKSDIVDNIRKVFGKDLQACVGMKMTLTLGYGKKAHPKYVEKDCYHIVGTDGEVVMDDDGDTPLVFTSSKAAQTHAIELFGKNKVTGFAEIKIMAEPSTPNNLKAFGGAKPKPAPAAGVVMDDDIPL